MPFGEMYDLENVEERRKQRLMQRNANGKELLSAMRKGEEDVVNYAFGVMFLLLIAAALAYWLLGPIVGFLVIVVAVIVHLHWMIRWVYQTVRVAQLNTMQGILMTMELYDDLQELIAERDKRRGHSS